MNGCFGCDSANTAGLGMRFFRELGTNRLAAACTPTQVHRGLGNIVNGGLVTTFAEELAAAAAGADNDGGLVVSRVEVDYELPAYIDTELRGAVVALSREGKAVRVKVEVASGGQRVATLNATFVLISEDRLKKLAGIGLDQAPACLVAARQPLPVEG